MLATPVSTKGVVTIGRDGRGTGFVLSSGRVLTNSHHLRDRTTLWVDRMHVVVPGHDAHSRGPHQTVTEP